MTKPLPTSFIEDIKAALQNPITGHLWQVIEDKDTFDSDDLQVLVIHDERIMVVNNIYAFVFSIFDVTPKAFQICSEIAGRRVQAHIDEVYSKLLVSSKLNELIRDNQYEATYGARSCPD